jgi:hypothetical protein
MTEEEKLKLLYDKYNKQRDEELSKFWKNSMYVWTFLMLCFTAYGVLIVNFIESSDTASFKLELALAGICSFGFSLSMVWTWMAQGLKAWYEVFEYAVWDLECYNNVFNLPSNYTVNNYWSVDDKKLSKSYSPSALVGSVGWCMAAFWVVAFCFNLCCYLVIEKADVYYWIVLGVNVLLVVLTMLFTFKRIKNNVKSSSLRTKRYEDTFVRVKTKLLEKNIPFKYIEVKHDKDKNEDFIRLTFNYSEKDNQDINKFVQSIDEKGFTVRSEYIISKIDS